MAFDRVTNTLTMSGTGVFSPSAGTPPRTDAPELGGSVQFSLSTGSCEVELRVWNISGKPEVVGTVTLPMATGQMYRTVPFTYTFGSWDYNVKSLSGGGVITATMVGVGKV